jgi:hypothetical protein
MAEHKLIRIGRAEGQNDIVIDHPSVSRVHCEIFYDGEGNAFLTDVGSANGTYVNGRRITDSALLRQTDIVKLGFGDPIPWRDYVDQPLNAVDSDVELEVQASESGSHHFVPVKKPNPVLVSVVMLGTIIIAALLVFALNSCSVVHHPPQHGESIPLEELNEYNPYTRYDFHLRSNRFISEKPLKGTVVFGSMCANHFTLWDASLKAATIKPHQII